MSEKTYYEIMDIVNDAFIKEFTDKNREARMDVLIKWQCRFGMHKDKTIQEAWEDGYLTGVRDAAFGRDVLKKMKLFLKENDI
jgi:hypothetical protein